ncbi:MAG TPA: glutamate ABC transporter substrate-binding protein [Paraburkholderia sp.]|uniref:glutamate ABC transporter substrate-binding protein n=1 Tax=Paraburkholderia sp. TaxID=1926495 RepID=UPI002C33BB31|nr:glutamate ABC transporter substrate-binding protein [Paraburkholderia sp.]HTR06034.1 glutamate ABC transporter substrate-binding protein [Paraburkholderia sp.]
MKLKNIAVMASCIAATLFAAVAPAHAADSVPTDSTMEKIQKRGKLVVGTSQNSLMFSVRNPISGQTEGFEADLARMLAKKLTGSADNVEFVKTTPENRLPLLQSGRVDVVISTLTINDQRKKVISFAGPYYIAGQDILTRRADTSIRSVADLTGKTACVLNGTTVEDNVKKFAPQTKFVTFADTPACVEGVVDGRFDAYVDDGAMLAGEALRQPNKFRIVGKPFTREPWGVGVSKDAPAFRNWINAQLEQSIKDGTWNKLYAKNLEGTLGQPQVPTIEP